MRVAIYSDIHGNVTALDAVINDITLHGGVDATWILGDLAAFGHAPVKTLARLARLPNTTIISGNTDRFLVTGEQPYPTQEQVLRNLNLLTTYSEVTRSLAWTQGAIATNGWISWLAALPKSSRIILLDGTRVHLEHASPGYDDGPALYPNLPEEVLRERFAGKDSDLIFVGHTHWALETYIDNVHIVNVGCVSNPFPPDLRSIWLCLDSSPNGYTLTYHRVDYDHNNVIDELQQLKHPGRRYIIGHMLGQHQPGWRS